MRSPLFLAFALALSCAPGPRALVAPADLGIDARRPDAELLVALAALPAGAPPLEALSAAARSDLAAALAAMPKERRAALGTHGGAADHPLLALAAGASSQEALLALATEGGTTRDLAPLRPRAAPRNDLPGVARRVARAAALAYARAALTSARAGAAVDAPAASALADVAWTLGDAHLRRLALARSSALDGTPARRVAAALAAAEDLDPEAARALGAGLALPPEVLGALATADRFRALGGASPRAEDALAAAEAAARLGRFDLLADLLARAGTPPESDLRAAVAFSLARLEGSTCMGLERSREPAAICPLAWRAHPELADVQRVLARAWASGAGRDPWSVETYAGLAHVIPLSYGGGGPTDDGPERSLPAHLAALRELLLEPRGLASPRGEALALLVDVLAATSAQGSARPATGREAASARARALSLLQRHPRDLLVARAALAVALAFDLVDVVRAVASAPELVRARAHVAAMLGLRHREGPLVSEAVALLEASDPRAEPGERARRRILARELRAATGDAPATGTALTDPESSFEDRLRAGIDAVGEAARLGESERAAAIFTRLAAELDAGAPDANARELVAAFETVGATLLAARPDLDARRRAEIRLRVMLERDGAPELRLYQALVLRPLLDRDARAACARDAPCRDAIDAELRRVDGAIARTRAALSDESVRLTEAGFLAGAGALRTSLRYGLGSGVDVAIEVEPIVLVMPTLPPARR